MERSIVLVLVKMGRDASPSRSRGRRSGARCRERRSVLVLVKMSKEGAAASSRGGGGALASMGMTWWSRCPRFDGEEQGDGGTGEPAR
jgi:hypothetical protein